MLVEQRNVDDSVFIESSQCSSPPLVSVVANKKKHAKSVKTSIIGENFIIVLAQQDKIFDNLKSSSH